jgi:uroporphyrin-III C-methyltransferase / precorrin-2 dehydrogenase / sirohydrochlorin ferrochelatase
MTALYPVFLKLEGLPVVVVGGGPVAASKLEGLLAAKARVTVIAPAIIDSIKDRAATDGLTIVEQRFQPAHLAGARWVVAAATPDVNRDVAAAAAARGLFVNAVDDPSVATAYLGGVIRRGPVEVAISTGGLAPALAGLLREALDAILPHDLERWADVAKRIRSDWKRDNVPMAERRPLLLRALARLYDARVSSATSTTSTSPSPSQTEVRP